MVGALLVFACGGWLLYRSAQRFGREDPFRTSAVLELIAGFAATIVAGGWLLDSVIASLAQP